MTTRAVTATAETVSKRCTLEAAETMARQARSFAGVSGPAVLLAMDSCSGAT